tara:strand:- start:3438 stop:3860 length:423 start_codon:yes stop_codon:yes gene_type:complete
MDHEHEDIVNEVVDQQPSEEDLDDFKNKINEWCKMDDQIKKLMIAVKERKKLQQALNVYIKEFMFKYNYQDVNVNNCRITAKKKQYLSPLSVNDMKKNILENKNLSGDELINVIFDPEKRVKKEKETIRRILPRITNLVL